jgi:hypothetical protein
MATLRHWKNSEARSFIAWVAGWSKHTATPIAFVKEGNRKRLILMFESTGARARHYALRLTQEETEELWRRMKEEM